ncbi:MAG: hypothetical protein BWY79_00905 [Actinobacteria bacterium ADurb.Bin444]|nr:MAG: hypothetical protein BWY79_00905 [Actinobacteria bacterium ADurb.Bin444]
MSGGSCATRPVLERVGSGAAEATFAAADVALTACAINGVVAGAVDMEAVGVLMDAVEASFSSLIWVLVSGPARYESVQRVWNTTGASS